MRKLLQHLNTYLYRAETTIDTGKRSVPTVGKSREKPSKVLTFAATTIDFAVTTVTLPPPITDSVPTEYDVSDSKTAKITKKLLSQ